MEQFHEINIEIQGVGFIFCSEHSVNNIDEGEDYLLNSFQDPDQVEEQARNGGIVGVSTGSPGSYKFRFFWGYPKNYEINNCQFKLRLVVKVTDSLLYVRDLYDLMEWAKVCPDNQMLKLEDGIYHITLIGNPPESGIIGDGQEIMTYLHKLEEMPKMKYNGVPVFC